jgi:hypothetical protein
MISTTRMNRIIQLLSPFMPKDQREAVLERLKLVLGYDAERAARFRKESKARNDVLDTIQTLQL